MRVFHSVSLAIFIAASALPTLAAVSKIEYEAVIEQARRGDTVSALNRLQEWIEQYPRESRYLYDYVTVLAWAGKAETALSFWPGFDQATTPKYVLLALGQVARASRQYTLAKSIYSRALQNIPREADANAGLALALADEGQLGDGLRQLRNYLKDEPAPYQIAVLPVLRAQALIEERLLLFAEAVDTYEKILKLLPADTHALRARVIAISRLGAPNLALSLAESNPTLRDDGEVDNMRNEAIAQAVRWGRAQAADDGSPSRYAGIDRALVEGEAVQDFHRQRGIEHAAVGRRAFFDHMVALQDRGRMEDVIAMYENALQRQYQIPPYAIAAAANAHLYERQPEKARELYLQALAAGKNERSVSNREWSIGLFYAYIECEQFREARKLIDSLVNNESPYINPGNRAMQLDNPVYGDLRNLQAQQRLYGDELKEAQGLLDRYLDAAPNNISARTSYGSLMSARGRPRTARQEFQSVLVDEPGKIDARIGYSEMQLALHEYRDADAVINELITSEPTNLAVQRAKRQYQLYQRRQLSIESSTSHTDEKNGDNVTGNRGISVDSYLYSAPIAYHWRAYARYYHSEAEFDEGEVARRRLGFGGELRVPDWEAMTEVNQDARGAGNTGVGGSLAWMPNDDWRLHGSFTTNSNQIPLKARLFSITGKDCAGWVFGSAALTAIT